MMELCNPKNHPTPVVLGAYYRYYNSKEILKLTEVREDKQVFYFECGHWCSDCVFKDLILVSSQLGIFD